jgi:hypothetical protein
LVAKPSIDHAPPSTAFMLLQTPPPPPPPNYGSKLKQK